MKEGKRGLRLICTAFVLTILLCGNVFAASDTGLIYGENGSITRAEWLHDLVVLFDMTVEEDNYPDNYFHDVTSDSKYYVDILKTVEFGVVDIPAGGDVEPDKPATREFVAHTLNYCLGYELGDNPAYTMNDADDLTYLQDAQVAVNRKWFALIGGKFSANTSVTSDEVKVMEADVRTVLSDGAIDENHENFFKYADGVIVVPENTPVSFEDNGTIIIDDPNIEIDTGDTFVVLIDGLPQPYTADSAGVLDGKCVISAKEIGTEDVVLSADAQGKLDANWYSVIPAAGTTVTYIEGGTAAASYADGIEHISLSLEDNIPIEAVKLEHTMEIGGVNVQVGGILSNLYLEYKIEGNDHHARVALKGSAEVTGSVNADLLKMGGVPTEIPLATIKYGPEGLLCGTLNVSIVIAVDGRLSVVYNASYFEVGLEYRDSTGIRVLKTFVKDRFYLETCINATLGLRAQATLSLPVVTGTIYGEMGAKAQYKSQTYDDGKKPLNCSTFHGWLYMETGSSLVISYTNLLTFKKEQKKLSKKQVVYDLNNSPVRLVHHWEDGVLVRSCARDKSKYWYTTGFNSRYGSLGDGYGYDETGNYVPVFTYSLAENEYHEQEATITGYTGSAYALSIPEEIDGYKVVAIDWDAFKGRSDLRTVSIPNTVTKICPYAFQNCINLAQVNLSKSLTEMENMVFDNCISLTSVWIPKSLVSANKAFSQCEALEHVSFEEGTKQIASGLFDGCTGLKQITIPETVTTISDSAFKGCVNLQEIEIPEAATEIGWDAFEGCIRMTSVQMEDGVAEIEPYAFRDCTKLSELKLSKNLTVMENMVFDNCISLTSVWIPKSLVSANKAFSQCEALEHVSFEEGTKQIASGLFDGCTGLKQITIPETVTTISDSAFKGCVNLQEIEIPEAVTEIGWNAFEGCTHMTSVQMGDGVTGIKPYAFRNCTELSELKLSENVVDMESGAFAGCISLAEVEIPNTLTTISGSAFRESGLVSLKLPDSINWIKDGAFQGCEQLRSIILSDSIVSIDYDAFRDCPALSDVTLGNGLKTIGKAVFRNCDALTTITIPDSVTSIGEYCFAESDVLTDVKLGTGITVIPSYTFDHCLALKSIVLPYRVARIELNAFTNCTQLAEITIPRSTVEIADMDSDSSKVFSYPSRMTIYGVAGTYAETYAKAKDIIFEAINHPAEKVSLDQTELKMLNGTSQRLVLSVEPTNFTDAVSWKSTDASIVSVDESGSGEITAKAVGTATIKVSAGTKNATCEVTVVQPVTSVSLNRSSLSLQALETFQLDASVYPDNAENKEIEWSSSDEEIASVDENGFVTAHKKGKATITVKALDGSEKKAACEVTVTNTAHEAESVEALESSHPYEMNCTDYWTYTDPNASENIKVAFDTRTSTEKGFDYIYIYDGKRNQVGKFTGDELSGKVITVPGDTVKIQLETDESADDESVEWGFRVTSITSGSEKLPQEFTGTTSYSKTYGDPAFSLDCVLTAGDGELSYESDNEAVASVDGDGNVTLGDAGTAHITVTAAATADYQRTQQTITVEVAKAQQELKLDYSVDTLYVGETLKLHATSENGSPSFTSDPETVATVSPDGVVTGVAPGAVKITAALAGDKNHEEAQEIASLTVLAVPEGSVSLTKCKVALASSSFVYDGKEKTPKATVSYNGTPLAEDTDYTLSYRNNVQPGTAYVVVKAVDGSGYYGVTEKEFIIKPKLPEDAKTIEPYAFSDCDDLYEANIGENITEIGDGAFAGCDNLGSIYFSGNAPKMGKGVFEGVSATAYYPADDSTWTLDVLESYGGDITWKAWDPETGKETKRSISMCRASLETTEYVYDGEPKTPAVTVIDGRVLLVEDTDYTVSYSDNTEPGAATAAVQGIGEYGGKIVLNFTICKLVPTLRFEAAAVSRTYGDAPFKNPLSEIETDGAVSYTSGNVNVAMVDGSGTVTIRGAGTTQITALVSAGESYEAGSASYTLTVAKADNIITAGDAARTWSKKKQSFAIGATAGGGAGLSYSSNNKSLPVNAAGVVTAPKKYIGSAVVTIHSAETANYKAAVKVITVSVNPKGTSIRKVKNSGAKSATVTWKKSTNVKGYQIQYSADKQFASGVKTKNVSGQKKVKLTLKKLKKGQTYYVRIRTWTKVKGKKYYSAWSKAKSVKIKK